FPRRLPSHISGPLNGYAAVDMTLLISALPRVYGGVPGEGEMTGGSVGGRAGTISPKVAAISGISRSSSPMKWPRNECPLGNEGWRGGPNGGARPGEETGGGAGPGRALVCHVARVPQARTDWA